MLDSIRYAQTKSHTATFKAQVTLEMLEEEKTGAQITSEHSIHLGPR